MQKTEYPIYGVAEMTWSEAPLGGVSTRKGFHAFPVSAGSLDGLALHDEVCNYVRERKKDGGQNVRTRIRYASHCPRYTVWKFMSQWRRVIDSVNGDESITERVVTHLHHLSCYAHFMVRRMVRGQGTGRSWDRRWHRARLDRAINKRLRALGWSCTKQCDHLLLDEEVAGEVANAKW